MKAKTLHYTLSALTISATALLVQPAIGDTALFPVVTSNPPNISTIISAVNQGPGNSSTHLTYIYRYKDAYNPVASTIPNRMGNCSTRTITRPTTDGDIVSFDVAGTLDDGNAMFGDANFYGGGFALGATGPQRGYLLVTNSDLLGGRVNVGSDLDVSGEFANVDLGGGAAWGGKAVNDIAREDFNFINAALPGGGVYSAMPSNGSAARLFTFFPPTEWTTRFFVTPIGLNMDSDQLVSGVAVSNLYDRDGVTRPFSIIVLTVTCTGAVDLRDLVDSSTWAAVENLGGWAYLDVVGPSAVVYKLEYSSAAEYNGTLNNGFLLSDYARP